MLLYLHMRKRGPQLTSTLMGIHAGTRMLIAVGIHDVSLQGDEKSMILDATLSSSHKYEEEVALVAQLKACTKQKDLTEGSRLHEHIVKHGLLKTNVFLGSTLINMYSKFSALMKAEEVFNELPIRNVITWNALISGYVQNRHAEKAIGCYKQMLDEGLSPDAVTFLCILKACGSTEAAALGVDIHNEIIKKGWLRGNIMLGTAIVDMYAKCGILEKAQKVFDQLPVRNVVSWTGLISGYSQHGHSEEALNCFEEMKREGLSPNAMTYACVLKACGSKGATEKGKEIHDEVIRKGLLENDGVLGTALVDMYAKCGALEKAEKIFKELSQRDIIAWNSLIAGYCQHGHFAEAVKSYDQLIDEGLSPDAVTVANMLKAYGGLHEADKGKELHDVIVRDGWLGKATILGSALVDMYAKCGALSKAQDVFDKLPDWDLASWNALIIGYGQHGHTKEVLNCYKRMRREGFRPDAVTFACTLKACGNIGDCEKGKELHAEIVREGWLGEASVLGSALVDMYAKCGALRLAQGVFDKLSVWDVVSWTALISGYCEHGHGEEALHCFHQMKREGFSPDAITYACALKACCDIGASEEGKEIHSEILREGLIATDNVLGNALVDLYAKSGALSRAHEIFDKLLARDVVSWTALMAGYCQHGHGEEAFKCLQGMKREGLTPDEVSLACMLKACGSMGAAEKGEEIHDEIIRKGLLGNDRVLGVALMDMHTKCGALGKAQRVFDELDSRDLFSWNALIAGYCQHGYGEEALDCFERMKLDGVSPDAVTFASILKVCGSMGAAQKGQMLFESMNASYGVVPTLEHHSCMVEMYTRAGHYDKAMAVIKKMPASDHVSGWVTLLGACNKRGNAKLGKFAFEQVV